jgi:hypothetical protein
MPELSAIRLEIVGWLFAPFFSLAVIAVCKRAWCFASFGYDCLAWQSANGRNRSVEKYRSMRSGKTVTTAAVPRL